MEMDIPLPGEVPPPSEIEPPDIPMPDDPPESPRKVVEPSTDSTASEPSQDEERPFDPPLPPTGAPREDEEESEDPNRYSPSLPIEEDDLPISDVGGSESLPLPPPPPLPSRSSTSSQAPVLGKTQAKKRLLAFSMTKQGGGAGVSFNLTKKTSINKETAKGFSDDKEETKKKPSKKGTVDKARDTISEIEELKRKEMQLLENMQKQLPHYGLKDALNLPPTLPLQLVVGEVLAKKSKREAERRKGRSRSPSEERRRSKSKKSDKDRERSKSKKKLPDSWSEFKKEGHKLRHFRRFKYEVEKEKLREKKRHRRSSRSRSREKSKKEKSPSKSLGRLNLLETPMVIKKVLVAIDVRGTADVDFPEYLVRYTKSRPSVSYCENPTRATYHLIDRKTMLSTVPRDIEELIVGFLNSIRPKRLRAKANIAEVSEAVKNVIESYDQLGTENEGPLVDKQESTIDCAQEEGSKSQIKDDVLKEEVNNKAQDIESSSTIKENEDAKSDVGCLQESEENNTEGKDISESSLNNNSETDKRDVEKDSGEVSCFQKIEICSKEHRFWYQSEKDWLVLHIPLTEEEDVEIEELDVQPNAVIVSEHFNDIKEEPVTDYKYNKKTNHKLRSRNISQSSTNAITEELEPIIKSAIRSKWDSDYEESEEERKPDEAKGKSVNEKLSEVSKSIDHEKQKELEVQDVSNDNLGVVPMEVEDDDKIEDESQKYIDNKGASPDPLENSKDLLDSNKQDPPDVVEKLASEYEEFMKMLGSEQDCDEEDVSNSNKLNNTSNFENSWEDETSDKENFVQNDSLSINESSHVHNDSRASDKHSDPSDPLDKQEWDEKKIYSNRSMSPSSTISLEYGNFKEVLIKHKILNDTLLTKKKKPKVPGSKINKKLKGKLKKSKKKKKKQTSSESSSSSSSSSSDSSASSSSSSTSDDSSSDSSSSSDSNTSSDSSVDFKKLKKRKLKKLKAKLRRKKKKKYDSSSESSESSEDDEDVKKRKKKKNKQSSKLKKKNTKGKVSKKKKNKKVTDEASESLIDQMILRKLKKKRKISDEEEENEEIPKKKKSKLDLDLVEEAVRHKKKSGKTKKFSKISKEKKKKEDTQKKKVKLKKKGSKDKSKSPEDDDYKKISKSKNKKQKKGEKKEKDIFLDFGESSKALKKLKDDDVKPEGSIQSIKKTGIKMSEEDFDIPNFESKRTFYPEDDVSLCQNDNVPFLGENKRLTEEDFEKDVVPVSYKNQEIDKETKEDCFKLKHIEDGNLSSIQPINKVNCDSTKKKSKKDKKEKKKKKEKGKIKGVLSIEAESDKKKKKKKKDKKVKSSSIGSFGDVINLRTGEEVVLHKKDLSEPKSSILTDKEVFKSDQKSFRESSQEINFENSLKLSPTRLSRTRKATDWSDDSETRGCFLKHNLMDDMNIVGEISHSEIHDEPELRKIDLPDKIPVVGFDSQSGDEYGRHSPNKMGECEKKMEQLDEDFRISKEKRERDSFFESLLKSSENSSLRMSPLISLTDNRESLNKEQIGSTKTNKSEEKKTNVVCAQVISRNKHSLSEDSVVLEKEPFIELDKKEQKFSGVSKEKELQTSLPSLHPNVPKLPQNNYDSERYSPTLDLYPLSPNSNEKVNSDMSLDSNGPEDSNSNRNIPSINMLDIPLPPCGVATQRIHSLPPALLPVPAPVPPPVMPVPPPSFSNILSLPVRPQIANIDSKTVSQPKNTEFKTTVTEIEKKAVKSIFTDPLKIPIKKKLNYGKPAPQLKQMNIFEDDDIEEGDESNLQNTGQSLFDRKLDSINMPKKISVGLGKTSESTKNTVFDQTKDTVESESLETTAVKEQSTQKKYVSNQQNNEEIKQYGNMSKLTSERDCELSFNETTSEEIKVTTKTPEITTLGAFSANIDVENARGAWKDSDDSINVVKQVQHNLEDKLDASSNKESENGTNNIPIKEEIVSDDQANDENIDSSNFDLNLVIKQEPESDVSQAVSSEKMQEESQDTEEAEKNKQLIEEEKKRKECEDNKGPRRRELSNERRERGRRDSSRERDRRRIRSRSRSRDRRRDRYRRDSPDRRSRRRDRSRERSRRSSKDRRRERSPRGRREQSRDCSPRRRDSQADNRNPERREYSRSDVNDKKSLDTPKHSVEKTSKQQSPQRKSVSPPRKKPSPFRSPSPLLKSPLYQKMTSSSQFPFSPSSYQSSPPKNNASPIPRKATSPKRTSMSPQRRHLSPHRRLSSPFKKSASPQRRDYSPQRRPPSPQSPYRSPSPYGRHSSLKLSSPKQRYSSPPRRPQSPWRPPSPPKRHTSPHRRPQSPGKRPSSSLKNLPCLKKSPSPWKPPSPPGLEQKKARQQTVDYSGRNPSPLGFKRSLADSTISDSDLPPIKKITRNAVLSPKRLPLDDRIELELGVKKSPPPPPPPVSNYPGYQSFYQIPVHDGSSLQLQPPPQQHRNPNLVQPPRLDWDASQQLMRQGKSTKVLQVGNILQVVPSEALPVTLSSTPVTPPVPVPIPPVQQPTATPTKLSSGPSQTTTVVQVGNMLQVVPSASTSLSLPPSLPLPLPHSLPLPMVSPSPSPPPATISAPPVTSPLLLPLPVAKKNIKVDDAALRRLEKEKRKKEKELKRQQKIQKQLLRKALLLKDTYPTVSELESQEAKLEAEDTVEEVASIPQVVVTPKVRNPLPPPPEKGILISPGFRERPLKEEKVRKSVSFADGVHPGEGEDPPLAEEHPHSPPPMAKEKHFKKSKKKRKVKVRIIRVEDGDDDDDDDDISPPPPPPGSPPPMFHYPPPPPGFMYVPPQTFTVLQGREGLTPLYQQHQSTTTTTHTTTVQFAPHPPPPPAPLHKSK